MKLKHDKLLSDFACFGFNCNLRHYFKAAKGLVKLCDAAAAERCIRQWDDEVKASETPAQVPAEVPAEVEVSAASVQVGRCRLTPL